MVLPVSSFLSTLRHAPLKFVSTTSYATTTKKVAALVCIEHRSSGPWFVPQDPTTTIYLPRSQLIISKSEYIPFCFNVTPVANSAYEKHYLSGDIFSLETDEEEGDTTLEIKGVVLIPDVKELKLENLAKEKERLEDLKFKIEREIADVEIEIEKECNVFDDHFAHTRTSDDRSK